MDFRKLAAEAIGTFWLTFGGCGSAVIAAGFPQVGIGLLGVSFAFGLTVLTMATLSVISPDAISIQPLRSGSRPAVASRLARSCPTSSRRSLAPLLPQRSCTQSRAEQQTSVSPRVLRQMDMAITRQANTVLSLA